MGETVFIHSNPNLSGYATFWYIGSRYLNLGNKTANIQGGPEKTAQTLMRYNFSTAGHRVTRFPAKCSETNW